MSLNRRRATSPSINQSNGLDLFNDFIGAAISNNLDRVDALLQSGFEVNFQDSKGESPLHHCAEIGNKSFVNYLLKHKAKVDICDSKGFTPLFLACCNGHTKIGSILIKKGADVNRADKHGLTCKNLKESFK